MIESGTLKNFKLVDLITILGHSNKNGELLINLRDSDAAIYFYSGNIIKAEFGSLKQEFAIYELMTYQSGDFKFTEINFEEQPKNLINKGIDELLKEGGLRIDLINSLRSFSIGSMISSNVTLKDKFFSSEDVNEINILNILLNHSCTILDLCKKAELPISEYTETLNKLMSKGVIEIEKQDEEHTWEAFQKTINRLYNEFVSISGIKMTKDLENKIQDLIETNSLNLEFKDGKIDTKDLFKLNTLEQLKIYKLFLQDLNNYISKIYGEGFVDNILNILLEEEPRVSIFLGSYNRAQ